MKKRTKDSKEKETRDSKEKQIATNDQNLGFPLFGLSLREAASENILVCAGGGGGAGRTGIGNGFSLYHFRSNGQGGPVLQLWRSYDTGEDSIGHLQLHPTEDVVACGIGNKCVTYSFGDGEVKEEKSFQTDFADSDSEQKVLAFGADGSLLLTAGVDGKIRLWKWPELSLLDEVSGHSGEIYSAQFDPANQSRFATVSTTGDISCKVWERTKDEKEKGKKDAQKKEVKCCMTIPTPGGQTGMRFRGCKFSPDGKYLFAVTAKPKSDSYLHKWDLASGKTQPIKTVVAHSRRDGGCSSFTISNDGKYIASGSSEGEIAIFKTSNMSWIYRRRVHDFFISKMEFNPVSTHVLSVGGDYALKATKVEVTRGFVSLYANWLLVLTIIVAIIAIAWNYF